jgi:hypothetical protein
MVSRIAAALVFAIAAPFWTGTARAESDPLRDPETLRIRASFTVDGIALFDPHAQHAARMGICAPSVFAGLKWCVSGTADEKKDDVVYAKTTGYNIDADGRIVYAISSRRGYPLKREEFDGIVQAVGERFGAGAAVLAFKKAAGDAPAADSLIAVWGGARLVQLTEAEYAQVEAGQSLRRGHLIDHRFNLVLSAKARDPIYKVEGEAGFVLQLMVTAPDRADVILRAVYPPVFIPPRGKPGAEAGHPLVGETVRRAPRAATAERPAERANGAAGDDRRKRIEAERGLAAERLLREEAERKIAEEKAVRAELERLTVEERRAFERERGRLDAERKAAEERAARAEAALKAGADRRSLEDAQRAAADAKRAEEARKQEAERKAEADRRAAEEAARRAEAQRAEAERKAAEERREPKRAEDAKPPDENVGGPEEAERKPEAERPPPAAARPQVTLWSFAESQDRATEERLFRARAIFGAPEGVLAVEITFECRAVGRDRRLRAYARAFDRKTLAGVAFRAGGEDSFGVRAQIRLDGQAPQTGLLFREHQDDIASILEIPMSAAERARDLSRAAVWLRHDAVAIEFPLATGTVAASIAPKDASLRRVLEACAQ